MNSMISCVSNMIKDAKDTYFRKTGSASARSETRNKSYWSLINHILNKTKLPIIPPLLENDIFVLNLKGKAEIFNNYFIAQCTSIVTGSEIPKFNSPIASPLTEFAISDEKILRIIRSLNPNKAHGWDDISIWMIKVCDDALLLPFRLIFENCLNQGIFPDMWKKANIVPIHKKNHKSCKENYCPNSLLPVFRKMLEKLIFDTLYHHLETNNILNPNHSGFRPGDSAVNQLISITNSTFQAFDCNPTLDVRSVYLDMSKAFDRVWHEGPLYKVYRCRISGKLFSLMKSFLAHSMQHTVLIGKASRWGIVTAGAPQGSISGPLFFLIDINNLTDGLKCNLKLFADDTSIFTVVHEPPIAAENLNHDLDLINLWATKWKKSFNPDPSKQAVEVIFSKKRCPRNHPPIFLKNAPVKSIREQKHLGVILDSKLSFASHVKSVISKCRQAIGMLKFLSEYLPRHTLNDIYKHYIRPHLDYSDVVYHSPDSSCEFSHCVILNGQMERLESI